MSDASMDMIKNKAKHPLPGFNLTFTLKIDAVE